VAPDGRDEQRAHVVQLFAGEIADGGGQARTNDAERVAGAQDRGELAHLLECVRGADPTGDALKHLADAGILVGDAARIENEGPPCPAQNLAFFVFGKPARTIHVLTSTGRAGLITAGYAYGSLVGIVALATTNRPTCAEVQAMAWAIRRVTATLSPGGDASRPLSPPIMLEHPQTGSPITVPSVDPFTAPP